EPIDGELDDALATLRRAASISPETLPLQEAYAPALIEAGREADAYVQYQKILFRWPRNTDALVNYARLAQRQGHGDDAINSWQRAIAIEPGQANAQMYLAQALDRRGEAQAAARHYRAY